MEVDTLSEGSSSDVKDSSDIKVLPNYAQTFDQEMSEDQGRWFDLFRKFFKDEYVRHVEFLRKCNLFRDKDWKSNFKHTLHKTLYKDCAAYQEVLEKMLNTNKPNLVIRSLTLTHVPSIIESQTQLSMLALCDLEIHHLPKEMSALVNLCNLTVTKCPVYEIPTWISKLTNLISFNFSRCRVIEVPKELNQCIKLVHLDIKFNWIRKLELSLPNLEKLDVEGNPIRIDWNLVSLPKLSILNISDTHTTEIPQNVSTRLIILHWLACKNIIVPEFGRSLRYINLGGSDIDRIPQEIYSLPNLWYINLPLPRSDIAQEIRLETVDNNVSFD